MARRDEMRAAFEAGFGPREETMKAIIESTRKIIKDEKTSKRKRAQAVALLKKYGIPVDPPATS